MTLAAGIGEYYWLIAAAAYGVFAWWNDRRQKKALEEEQARQRAEGASEPKHTPLRTEPAASANSEEERMRKFLEALGVPSAPQSPPLRPAPQPAPLPMSKPPKPASPTMAPRPIAQPIPRPFQRPAPPRSAMPAPVPRPVVVVEPIPAESRDAGGFEEAGQSFDEAVAVFVHGDGTSPADSLPSISIAAAGSAPTTRVVPKVVSLQGLALREMIKDPKALRAAIVVSEVLGPPKGL